MLDCIVRITEEADGNALRFKDGLIGSESVRVAIYRYKEDDVKMSIEAFQRLKEALKSIPQLRDPV